MFSTIMVVGFGKDDKEEDDDEAAQKEDKPSIFPYPTVTFKIVNLLHSQRRGEIIDAGVEVVAIIEAKNAIFGAKKEKIFSDSFSKRDTSQTNSRSNVLYNSFERIKNVSSGAQEFIKKGGKRTAGQIKKIAFHSHQAVAKEHFISDSETQSSARSDDLHSESQEDDIYIQDEPDQPNMVFASLKVSPKTHPFFRSSWRVIHTLDADSPLLTKKVRRIVRKAGGWPKSLNNHKEVKDAIHFDSILVTFKGTSNISGASVYSQTAYKMDCLRIGYEFKSVLMQNIDGSIFVRCADVDEIRELPSALSTKVDVNDMKVENHETIENNETILLNTLPDIEEDSALILSATDDINEENIKTFGSSDEHET